MKPLNMHKLFISYIFLFSLIIVACTSSKKVHSAPEDKYILGAMELTNKYFMDKWPDAGKTIFTNIERPSNIWTRAVYYEGLLALQSVDPKDEYYRYALQWGEKHNWSLRGGAKTRNADNQCCGQTLIDLYLLDKRQHPEWIKDVKTSIDSIMLTSKVDDWNWIDAIQMAMPVFARLGKIFNDPTYYDRMYEMYSFAKHKHGGNGLYNAAEKLWWRDKDFVPPYKEPNGANCYWSRGNGWVVAALVRVMQQLPNTDPHYAEYLQDYKDMLAALLPLRREDGFWNVSLHDPSHFGGKELSGTALFVYGMAWGVNNNIVDKKTYAPVLLKAWNALIKDCLHPDGALGFVQGTGKEPKDGQPVAYDHFPDFEDYGLGCFLLAGSEVYKMK